LDASFTSDGADHSDGVNQMTRLVALNEGIAKGLDTSGAISSDGDYSDNDAMQRLRRLADVNDVIAKELESSFHPDRDSDGAKRAIPSPVRSGDVSDDDSEAVTSGNMRNFSGSEHGALANMGRLNRLNEALATGLDSPSRGSASETDDGDDVAAGVSRLNDLNAGLKLAARGRSPSISRRSYAASDSGDGGEDDEDEEDLEQMMMKLQGLNSKMSTELSD
jgi:hypothetical protein